MTIFLETDRLVLRRFTGSDVDDLVALDADPDVMRYLTGGVATPRARIVADYHERFAGFGRWAAEDATGAFLGWFHLRPKPHDPPNQVELGYRLVKSAWGRGYATEGAKALVDKGFAEVGVERVYAETMVVNTASRRVMEKTGLKLIRVFHQDWPHPIDGSEHGEVEYALTRSEWEAGS